MSQNDRQRQDRNRMQQDRNRNYDRQNRGYENRDPSNRQQDDDWARQVPWEGNDQGDYRDYGWERGQSALPEFRDPGVHIQPYERQRVSRWDKVDWNRDYNYGVEDISGPYQGMGPKGYQRSDERIFDDVCDRLTRHGQIDARNMEVNVQNGEVTLTGTVDSRQTKRMAENVAEKVRGVRDVHNQLRVQDRNRDWNNESGNPGGGRGRTDEVGGSGVYPASGPMPNQNAPVQGEASWGQGDRGAAGYQDSGRSEINNMPNEQNQGRQQGKGQQNKS